jgi:hypothetical protein
MLQINWATTYYSRGRAVERRWYHTKEAGFFTKILDLSLEY